jgi:hypothetical protein
MAETTDLQRLVVSLEARLDKYTKAIEKASGDTDHHLGHIESQFHSLEGVLSKFGIGLGLAEGLNKVKEAIEGVARVGEIAQRIGITTRALQAMDAIGIRTGATVEQIDKALQSLAEQSAQAGSFLDKLFKAQPGGGPVSKDTEENLRRFMQLLRDAGSESDRLFIATQVFGDKVGRAVVEAFAQGPQAIDQMASQLEARSELLTNSQIEEAAKIRKAYLTMLDDIDRRWESLAVNVFGWADRMLDKLIEVNDAIARTLGLPTSKDILGEQPPTATGKQGPPTVKPATEKALTQESEAKRRIDQSGARQLEQIQKTIESLQFESDQLTRTDREQAIYNALKQAGIDTNSEFSAQVSQLAGHLYDEQQAIKDLTDNMDFARDSVKGFASDLIHGLKEGKSLTEALGNAFDRLADKMIDRLLDQAVEAVMGKAGTTQGGILGQLLGIPEAAAAPSHALAPGGIAPVEAVTQKALLPLLTRQPGLSAPGLPNAGVTLGVAGTLSDMFGSMKRNNPGNLKFGPFAARYGGTGNAGGLASFPDLASGFEAQRALLEGYGRQGINTVGGVINKWAPVGPENSQASVNNYSGYVAGRLGVGVNAPIDLADPKIQMNMMESMTRFEHGLTNVANVPNTLAPKFAGDFQGALGSVLSAVGGAGGGAGGGGIGDLFSSIFGGGGLGGEHGGPSGFAALPKLGMPTLAARGPAGGGSGALAFHIVPSKYFDVHVERISGAGDVRTLDKARRAYPDTAARFGKLGTTSR